MDRLQRIMLANGFLVILVSMLAGFMLMFSLLGGLEVWPGTIVAIPVYGTGEGWVRAHSGGAMNGLLVIVIALALPKLSLSPTLQRFTAYGFIYVAWSFTVFYWFGNAAANRALTIGDNPLGASDIFGVIGFLPGLPSVVIVVILLGVVAKGVLSGQHE
ncbi:MAG: isomerase [Gammaproteobacteria bacterium]|nr:isomerase [Gammaproteobacteria bacterium]